MPRLHAQTPKEVLGHVRSQCSMPRLHARKCNYKNPLHLIDNFPVEIFNIMNILKMSLQTKKGKKGCHFPLTNITYTDLLRFNTDQRLQNVGYQ